MKAKGELLWSGVLDFPAATGSNGLVRVVDVPSLLDNDYVEVIVRNASGTEDITVRLGHLEKMRPYRRGSQKRMSCTPSVALDTLTTVLPHNLKVGDRVAFEETSCGFTVNVYYYVIPSTLMTDFVFQLSASPGGTTVDINAATAKVFDFVPSPVLNLPSANGVIATDVYNCLTPHGLAVGDAVQADATVDIVVKDTYYYVIATATQLQFQLSASRNGTTLDVAATTAVALHLVDEFYQLTSFVVPKWASGAQLVPVVGATYAGPMAGMESRIVQGFALGSNGGRICVSPGDQIYSAFAVGVEIRRT